MNDKLEVPFDIGCDHGRLYSERLTECPRESEARPGGVHGDLARGQDLGDFG